MISPSNGYSLVVRQEPERAKAFVGPKEKDRKPVDPPPIVQLRIRDPADPAQNYLQSPYFFMCCNLLTSDDNPTQIAVAEQGESLGNATQSALAGNLVSSLHRLKDVDNSDGGFFVFPDVSARVEGEYRLKFSLFEILKSAPKVVYIKSIVSKPFTVFAPRAFPGMSESTFLSRSFGDQGVKLRIRKEPRILGKRSATSDVPYHDAFRGHAQIFPPDYRGMTLQSQPEHVGGFGPSMYRDPGLGYDEPSVKRQRASVDLGRAHEANQRSTNRSFQNPDQYQNPLRDASMSGRACYHSQGQSSAPGSVSEFGHQRTNSSSVSSPFSPQNEYPSNYGPTPVYQPSNRDGNFNFTYNHYASTQSRSSSSFSQPAPVPINRRLPSSGPPQSDSSRSQNPFQESTGPLPSAIRYNGTDVPEYQQPHQTHTTQYDHTTQPMPRTLPPPTQYPATSLPPLTPFPPSQLYSNNGAGTEVNPYSSSLLAGAGSRGSAASSYRSGPTA